MNTIKHTVSLLALVAFGLAAVSAVAQVWTPRGPAAAINGQIDNIATNPVTGAIEAVVAHPATADIIWIGAVNGGIWKTSNATSASPTWAPLTDSLAGLSISALELDPTDTNNDTLVAGLGPVSSFNVGSQVTGVLRTTNGGTSWTMLSNGIVGRRVSGISARGSTIVVSVENAVGGFFDTGIYRSTDTGANFTQVTGEMTSGLPLGRAYDLASDPTDTTRLFTIIEDNVEPGSSGIYRSDDTGKTWAKISNAAQDAMLDLPASDANLAVGAAGPTTPNVFAAICDGNGALAGLYRTGNAAAATPTWATLDLPAGGLHTGGQCGAHLSLVADPTNANVAYVGGDTHNLPGTIGAEDFTGRLFKVDAGQSGGSQARPITHCSGVPLPSGCGGVQSTASNSAPHADSREMVFDVNGDIIEVDDGGIYRHTDPSGTTGDWVSVIGNLALTEQHDAAHDAIANIILSGNQDTGTTQQMTNGMTWDSLLTADGGDVAVAEGDPVANQSTRYFSTQQLGGLTRSVYDASNQLQGTAFPALTPLGGDPALMPLFISPLAVNAVTPTRMIVAGSNGTYESSDRMDTISRITTVSADGRIAYGATGNADVLYFPAGDSVYWRTAAPGTAPVASDPDGASTDEIRSVIVDPDTPNTAFAVDPNQVYWTVNAATSWTDVTGNLLSLNPGELRSVAYINSPPDQLVVGSDNGVYVSTQTGGFTTWSALGTGLPNTLVFDMEYDTVTNSLIAGTLGRGAWVLSFGPACPGTLTFDNQVLTGTQSHDAGTSITLGPNLTINGASIAMRAPTIVIRNNTNINGGFTASNTTICAP